VVASPNEGERSIESFEDPSCQWSGVLGLTIHGANQDAELLSECGFFSTASAIPLQVNILHGFLMVGSYTMVMNTYCFGV
jgi:hypothetical protein